MLAVAICQREAVKCFLQVKRQEFSTCQGKESAVCCSCGAQQEECPSCRETVKEKENVVLALRLPRRLQVCRPWPRHVLEREKAFSLYNKIF